VPVKNTGLLLAAIIPGAFVEPDEESLRKAKKSTQARVYAAGSTTNIILALLVLGLVVNSTAILSPFYETNVQIVSVVPGSPADGVLKVGDQILSVNGSAITDIQSLSVTLSHTLPNSTVPLTILRDNQTEQIQFKLGYSNTTNSSYIGVDIQNYYQPKSSIYSSAFPFYFTGLISWLYLLSLNIGLINLLPVFVFDGGRFANILARFVLRNEKWADQFSNVLQLASLGILVLNILLSFVFFPNFQLG
jgi:membrane-associated protease RseP (regulator of RpoE activity)